MPYWLWVPSTILLYAVSALLWKQTNDHKTAAWFCASWALGVIPLWTLVARGSRNLAFDAFLYDFLMVAVGCGTLVLLQAQGESWGKMQWLGAVIALTGLIVMRVKP